MGLIPGLGRTSGGGNGNPLQHLAWEILWTEESGVLQSMGSQRVGRNSVTEQQKAKSTVWHCFNLKGGADLSAVSGEENSSFLTTLPLKFRALNDKLKSPWGEIGFLGFWKKASVAEKWWAKIKGRMVWNEAGAGRWAEVSSCVLWQTDLVLSISGSYQRGLGREVRGSHFYFSKKTSGCSLGNWEGRGCWGMEGRHERYWILSVMFYDRILPFTALGEVRERYIRFRYLWN